MNNGQKSPNSLPLPSHCPYLNLRDDPQTSLAFPSIWNYCYRAVPPASVRIEHQVQVCQTARFSECTVFQRKESRALPVELQSVRVAPKASRRRSLRFALLGLLLLVILFLWGIQAGFNLSSLWNLGSIKSPLETVLSTPSVPAVPSSNLILAPSRISQSTATPKINATTNLSNAGFCGVPLDTPIGTDQKFIIHRVARGESLNGYEAAYRTSSEAILAVNYGLHVPVLSNAVIVIPLDQTDASALPSFDVYQADESDGPLDSLSSKLGVDPQELAHYNDLSQPCPFFSGWLLVPRQTSTP